MKESFWAYLVIIMGIVSIFFVFIFNTITNTSEHNYNLLKDTTEAAMYDALDMAAYREDGTIRIDREKFVENFIRRFAENASYPSDEYIVEIYDVNEEPPKVSLRVKSTEKSSFTDNDGDIIDFTLSSRIDAIMETPF